MPRLKLIVLTFSETESFLVFQRQTFDFIALSKQQKIEADPNGLSGSSNYFDSSGNWLMQSGYFEFWHGKKSVDLMAELLRLVEVCEREIETIKAVSHLLEV